MKQQHVVIYADKVTIAKIPEQPWQPATPLQANPGIFVTARDAILYILIPVAAGIACWVAVYLYVTTHREVVPSTATHQALDSPGTHPTGSSTD